MTFSAVDAFGFHSQYQIEQLIGVKADHEDAKVLNLSMVMGYFPVVGTIVGIFRLIITNNAAFMPHVSPDFILSLQFRAIIELCSLGFLLIIPDLVITIGRIFFDVIG
jgi:hypothetical protein